MECHTPEWRSGDEDEEVEARDMERMGQRCMQFDIGSDHQDGGKGSEAEGSYAVTQSGDEEVQCRGIDDQGEDVAGSSEEEGEHEEKEIYESGGEGEETSGNEEKIIETPDEIKKQKAAAGIL